MGGRLSLTMHGASVGSWGNPAKPRIKAAGHEGPARLVLRLSWTPPQTARRPTFLSAPAPGPAPCGNLLCRQSVSARRDHERGSAEIAAPGMNLSAGYRD